MKKLLLLFMLGILVIACKKEVLVPNSGIYRGTFTKYDSAGDTIVNAVTWMSMDDNQLTFTMTTDSLVFAPAQHYGTYAVENASAITFKNSSDVGPPYQPDYYLDTIYTYSFDDKNFKFWQTIGDYFYEYDLVRW